MKALFASLLVLSCGALVPADPPVLQTPITVSVSAAGTDVKTVLGDLFKQAHKNYVIQPETYFALHLSLDKVDFDEALMIISQLANLKIDIQDGIYYISRGAKKPAVEAATTPPAPVKPHGTLPKTVLTKKITTRLSKATLNDVIAELGRQSGVTLEIDKSVPVLKLDAFLINTSLKYALDEITKAAGLDYKFTDNLTIQIYKPAAESSHVGVING